MGSGSSPVVLARHIDQTTFLLFKALGVRGVQYYSWLIPGELYHELKPLAKQIGWTHVRPIEQIAEHQAMGRMRAVLRHFEEHPGASVPDAVLHGASCNLTSGTASPEALLRWANEAEVPFVKGWRDAVHRWAVWAQYQVPRRPGAASWKEPPAVHPEPAKRTARPTAAPERARPERTVRKKNPQPPVDEQVPQVSRIGINIHRRR